MKETNQKLPILDEEQIQMLVETGGAEAEQLFEELIRLFVEETGPRLTLIEEALEKNDLSVVAKQAHAVAGASANLGAIRLSQHCRQLERRILDNPNLAKNAIAQEIVAIRPLYETSLQELRQRVLALPPV